VHVSTRLPPLTLSTTKTTQHKTKQNILFTKHNTPYNKLSLANTPSGNRALSVLNLASNNLGALVLPEGWTETGHDLQTGYDYDNTKLFRHTDGREQKGNPSKPEGVTAIANAIPDTRAMTRLDISANNLGAAGTKVLTEGLKGNQIMTELDISSNSMGKAGAMALANIIPGMRAMTRLDISKSQLGDAGTKALAEGLKGNQIMIELNISSNGMGKLGAIALADIIPGMGTLSIANVMGNRVGKEYLSKLQKIMRSKPSLISLCGMADDATEADLSGLRMDADDAIVLAAELPDKGALTSLNLSSNNLKAEGGKIVAEAIKVTRTNNAMAVVLAPVSSHLITG
jgi:hypothetical protein